MAVLRRWIALSIATHERLMTKGGARLDLDHYLEVFASKPGAFPGATALEQARAAGASQRQRHASATRSPTSTPRRPGTYAGAAAARP